MNIVTHGRGWRTIWNKLQLVPDNFEAQPQLVPGGFAVKYHGFDGHFVLNINEPGLHD